MNSDAQKKLFVTEVRRLLGREPSREEWEKLWQEQCKNRFVRVCTVIFRVTGETVDSRFIPAVHRKDSLPLAEIAERAAQIAKQFETGGFGCSK